MSKSCFLAEREDHWVINLTGKAVTRCLVDNAFSLEFWTRDEGAVTLRIEGTFTLKKNDSSTVLSADRAKSLAPALALFGNVVASAMAGKDGSVRLSFSDGTSISSEPDPDYEAWELSETGGKLIVSKPGGGLAIWCE